MAKNILLLFLSPVRIDKIEDKVIVSEAYYKNLNGEKTKTTNESAIRYLLQKNINLDEVFIFSSKKVKRPILSGESQTHQDFFLERLKKFAPLVTYTIYNYDEDQFGDENLKSVTEMARLIQNFTHGEEVTLHVDLTGGMRHVNMIMLELTRLLEYSGLTVGNVLYSNYDSETKIGNVEELKNVYDIFQLMAGVEEFVNFGSVKALTDKNKGYYADKKISKSLRNLLTAMENFAEAIKLCHYGQFHNAIINLHDAVRDFEPAPDDLQDILMERFIGRIRKNYADLINLRDLDDLRVIRWCLENDYLQQALTLYTERIPEYLGEKRIITQRADEYRKLFEALGGDVRSPNFYFLNVYKSEDPDFQSLGNLVHSSLSKMERNYAALIKNIPAALKNKLSFDEWYEQVDKLREKICTNIKLVSPAPIAKEHIVCEDEQKLREQYELLACVAAGQFETLSTAELRPLGIFFRKLKPQLEGAPPAKKRKLILNAIGQMKVEDVKKYFPLLVCNRNAQIFRLKMMLDKQIFSVTIDEEIFFNIMEKYFRIKSERNQSNHARADFGEFPTADSLRNFMLDALNEIGR